MKQILTIGVVFLLLIVAFPTSISVNIKSSNQNNEIYTTQICRLDGVTINNVKLSIEEIEQLEILFKEIQNKLNVTTSKEETEVIFEEAVVEFHKYGLLGNLSIEEAKELVTDDYYDNFPVTNILKEALLKHEMDFGENQNFICLTAGATLGTQFCGPTTWLIFNLAFLTLFFPAYIALILFRLSHVELMAYVFFILDSLPSELQGLLMEAIALLFAFLTPFIGLGSLATALSHFNPLPILSSIGFGYDFIQVLPPPGGLYHIPAMGFVWTIGLNGIKSWNGLFTGNHPAIPIFGLAPVFPILYSYFYVGAVGFTGLHIGPLLGYGPNFYLGTSLLVNISAELPWSSYTLPSSSIF